MIKLQQHQLRQLVEVNESLHFAATTPGEIHLLSYLLRSLKVNQ